MPGFVRSLLAPDNRAVMRYERAGELLDVGDVQRAVTALASLTTLGGSNDPRDDGSAEPWKWLIAKLFIIDPHIASFAARRWYATLVAAGLETEDERPVRHRPFAATVAGIIDAYVGNDVRAEHWLAVGDVEAEFDETEMTTFALARDFVSAIVHAGRQEAR